MQWRCTILVSAKWGMKGRKMTTATRSVVTTSTKSIWASAAKRRTELRRYVSWFAATEFEERATKVLELDLPHLSLIDTFVRDGVGASPEPPDMV